MVRIDPAFERIARRLSTLELRQHSAAEEARADSAIADPHGHAPHDFVHTYSEAGIRRVIAEYGLQPRLEAQGLGDVEVHIEQDDPFRHRLMLTLPPRERGDRKVMDMRLHLCTLGVRGDQQPFEIVVVDWLLMQNPRRDFSAARPRLPGQNHPGTGLGRAVGQLLALLCRRIGRAGLLVVPEHFHLAELYAAGGYRAVEPDEDAAFQDLLKGTRALSFAARAWAVERSLVMDDAGEAVPYRPHARVLPMTPAFEAALDPGGRFFRELLRTPRHLVVDKQGLRRSLRQKPVEGLDPNAIA